MYSRASAVALIAAISMGLAACVVNTTKPATEQTQSSGSSQTFFSYTKGALSGVRQKVDVLYSTNPDCTSIGYPTVRIKAPPASGRLLAEPGEDYPSFNKDNVRFVCNDRKVPMIILYYESDKDFQGTDGMTIEVIFPSGTFRTVEYKINVR